jgi:hypothetical protein
MTIDYDAILNSIINAKAKNENPVSKNYLKIDTIGNTIIGRILPYLPNTANTDIPFYSHGWKSKLDGSNIFFPCQNNYGEKCLTCIKSIQMWQSKNELDKVESKKISRRQNWVTNFYIISDAKNPENNDKIKILKFGLQIRRKIDRALTGDDKDIYGKRILRLDGEGCSFRIVTAQNTIKENDKKAWPTYADSSFLPQSEIPNMTPDKINTILKSTFDLKALFQKTSDETMQSLLNKHFFTNEVITMNANSASANSTQVENVTTIVVPPPATETKQTPTIEVKPESKTNPSEDEIDKMLKELQG